MLNRRHTKEDQGRRGREREREREKGARGRRVKKKKVVSVQPRSLRRKVLSREKHGKIA